MFHQRPVLPAREVTRALGSSPTATNRLLADIESLGIPRETTGYKRNRLFVLGEYLALFEG